MIRLAHEEGLPHYLDFLENALSGRALHPVEHYYGAADRLVFLLLLGSVAVLLLFKLVAARKREVLLLVVSVSLSFVLFDLSLRLIVKPSPHSYGSLFGRELPPFPVIPYNIIPSKAERIESYKAVTEYLDKEGNVLTFADLSGRKREDDLLDYVLMENWRSPNDWFITNSLGARSDREYEREIPDKRFRILAFGDSFTAGEQVPQWETWTQKLEEKDAALEVINFGSSGYGMGQAYRSYLQVREKLDYDLVLMNPVPFADLYRDVNVMRYLPNRWNSFKPQSRYVLKDGELQLIRSPYQDLEDMLTRNPDRPSKLLLNHLTLYEPFYFPEFHEDRSILRFSICYKLFRSRQYQKTKKDLFASIHEPESEAMQINMKIFEKMSEQARTDRAELLLVLHPGNFGTEEYKKRGGFYRKWNGISQAISIEHDRFYDLLPYLLEIPESELDVGMDGTHYGPSTNEKIADALWDVIEPLVIQKTNR